MKEKQRGRMALDDFSVGLRRNENGSVTQRTGRSIPT